MEKKDVGEVLLDESKTMAKEGAAKSDRIPVRTGELEEGALEESVDAAVAFGKLDYTKMTEDEFDAAATASMHKLQANMEAQRSMDAATIDSKYSWMLDLSLDELVAKYAPQKGTTSVAGTIEWQSQQKRSPGQQHRFGASPL